MGWPLVRLGKVISQRKVFIEIAPDETYARCRVQTSARGIILRDRVAGAEIKTKRQQVCRTGEFLVAEIDAKLGGYGIVPEELDGAIVSSHYFLFEVDETKLLRGFLDWYSRTPVFLEQVKARGSTNYAAIRPSNVLDYRMPLPPLDEQQRIVARLDRVAGLVAEVKSRRAETDADATQLLERLHFDLASNDQRPFGDFVSLSEDRTEIAPDQSYPQIGIRGFAGGLFFKEATAGSDTSYKSFNRVHPDMLVVSQPKGWEGAIAVAEDEHAGWFVSPEYRTFVCRDGSLLPAYLRQLVGTNWFQSELAKLTRGQGARRERLRPDMLLDMPVRMPSLAAQRKTLKIHEKIQHLRAHTAPFAYDADALIPALLHEVFNGKAVAA